MGILSQNQKKHVLSAQTDFAAFSLPFHGVFTGFSWPFHLFFSRCHYFCQFRRCALDFSSMGRPSLARTWTDRVLINCWGLLRYIGLSHTSSGTNHQAFLRPSHCVYIQIRCGVLPGHIQWCFLSTLGSGNHGGYDSRAVPCSTHSWVAKTLSFQRCQEKPWDPWAYEV